MSRCDKNALQVINENELGKKRSHDMLSDAMREKQVERAPAESVGMYRRLKQRLFDACNTRKGAARDCSSSLWDKVAAQQMLCFNNGTNKTVETRDGIGKS